MFNSDFFKLQLDYTDPNLVNAENHYNQLRVTFWGTDFFKAKENDETVRFGTVITWQIFRQIEEKEASAIDTVQSAVKGISYAVLVPTTILAFFSGSLLPVWMFINSLSLIAHVPLLSSELPANINYFLLEYLNLLRLNSPKLDENMEGYQRESELLTANLIREESNAYTSLLNTCGYKHDFITNLFTFICLGAVIVLVWIGMLFAD